jgi:hypothetical protein
VVDISVTPAIDFDHSDWFLGKIFLFPLHIIYEKSRCIRVGGTTSERHDISLHAGNSIPAGPGFLLFVSTKFCFLCLKLDCQPQTTSFMVVAAVFVTLLLILLLLSVDSSRSVTGRTVGIPSEHE